MAQRQDLDQYRGAYKPGFKFYEENLWYLGHYAERISAVIEGLPVRTMLSLGIGHQAVSDRILAHVGRGLRRYVLLEGSEKIITRFRDSRNLPDNVEIVHGFFEDFDTTERFDAIEMGFILEHVDDPGSLLRKYRDYLDEDGLVLIAVPNARSLHRLIGHQAGLLNDLYQLSEQDHELGHKRYFDLESLTDLVEECGLKVQRRQGLMLKPITGDQIAQLGWGPEIIAALLSIGDDYPEIANCILLEASR